MSAVDPVAQKQRWTALVVLCAGFLMITLDQTIVNVALPTIQNSLGFSQADLAWVVNAYLITFGGLLMLAGRLGDLIGRKRVFLGGLALFTGASLWCGLSSSSGMLIAARFVQGAGGAITSAVILGMVVTLFTAPGEQGRAIGIYSFVGSGGAATGLLVGGVLTQAISWNWIFYVNIPIGILVAVVGWRVLDREEGLGLDKGADLIGAVLITGALMLGVYTILKVVDYGWLSAHTLGLGAVALLLLGLFVLRQATAKTPLMSLRIFKTSNLAAANLILGLMLAGMFGQFFLGTLYLQRVLGFTPIEIGASFLPVAVEIGAMSMFVAPKLMLRYGERAVLIPSLLCIVAGLALLSRVPVGGSYAADVLPALVLNGIGGGLGFPALVTLAMSGAAPADSGVASGINNTTQQVGGAVGLAVLATLAASRTQNQLGAGHTTAQALTSGYNLAFAVASGIVAVGAVLAVFLLHKAKAPQQDGAAEPADLPPEPVLLDD